jgi:hypothetical protein
MDLLGISPQNVRTDAQTVANRFNEIVRRLKTFLDAPSAPSFAVASLPTATAGLIAFASNGRKVGEGAGSGTGTMVYADGTAWRRVGDDTTVVA